MGGSVSSVRSPVSNIGVLKHADFIHVMHQMFSESLSCEAPIVEVDEAEMLSSSEIVSSIRELRVPLGLERLGQV